jgi:hypothetical protein
MTAFEYGWAWSFVTETSASKEAAPRIRQFFRMIFFGVSREALSKNSSSTIELRMKFASLQQIPSQPLWIRYFIISLNCAHEVESFLSICKVCLSQQGFRARTRCLNKMMRPCCGIILQSIICNVALTSFPRPRAGVDSGCNWSDATPELPTSLVSTAFPFVRCSTLYTPRRSAVSLLISPRLPFASVRAIRKAV